MITVTVSGTEYQCETAIKGPNFVELYDAEGTIVASFFEIADFDEFTIEGGDWTPYVEEVLTCRGATISGGLITMAGYDGIETGSIIKLRAPAASENVTQGISIDGEAMPIVNAMNEPQHGVAGVWASGVAIALLIDKVNWKAYLMNGGTLEQYDDHIADTDNPHEVTAAQVGADPAGSAAAVQSNLTAHTGDTSNPHSVTATQVGAAEAIHTHQMTDLSGVLPVNKGGTGQSSIDGLVSQLAQSGIAKMQIVSYVGTGTSGESNPCSITADFPIKAVIVLNKKVMGGYIYNLYFTDSGISNLPIEYLEESYTRYTGLCLNDNYNSYGKKSADKKKIYWYHTGGHEKQLNERNYIYSFLIFG